MSAETLYRVIFHNQNKIYELYCHSVNDGGLLGFIEIEGLVFDEKSQLVVDPTEEKLKTEFKDVERTYVPMHSVVRIDEVEKQGTARISEAEGNVTPFPSPFMGPGQGNGPNNQGD